MVASTSLRRASALALAAALVLGFAAYHRHHRADWRSGLDADELSLTGVAGNVPDSTKPKLTEFFPKQSYRAGSTARLEIADRAPEAVVRLFRASTSMKRIAANDVMTGTPVTARRDLGAITGRRTVSIRLGAGWPSGVYYAQ